MENELADHILDFERRLFGLNTIEVRKLAYEFAERAELDHKKTVTNERIPAHMIYNMNESELTTVQKPLKVFASKGKKQVGAITSAERAEHITVAVCEPIEVELGEELLDGLTCSGERPANEGTPNQMMTTSQNKKMLEDEKNLVPVSLKQQVKSLNMKTLSWENNSIGTEQDNLSTSRRCRIVKPSIMRSGLQNLDGGQSSIVKTLEEDISVDHYKEL
ncbi:hypothetical protein ILUMI_24471 [Ignelater luminosus]|uniref:Uncharacterized protein n=1 Tax=Ignelater luminosus TaxID=2038154 RepID=A0A8K0CBW2_IGNLU|nr:hypothetical protein ILUMI_24471 [Ignelater luminosus]